MICKKRKQCNHITCDHHGHHAYTIACDANVCQYKNIVVACRGGVKDISVIVAKILKAHFGASELAFFTKHMGQVEHALALMGLKPTQYELWWGRGQRNPVAVTKIK